MRDLGEHRPRFSGRLTSSFAARGPRCSQISIAGTDAVHIHIHVYTHHVDITGPGLHRRHPRLFLPDSCNRYLTNSLAHPFTARLTCPSIGPILSLGACRRAHSSREETAHPAHLCRHRCPDPTAPRRWLPPRPECPQRCQPWRLCTEPAPLPCRQADRAHVPGVLRYVTHVCRNQNSTNSHTDMSQPS
jgi:hypothetical protein